MILKSSQIQTQKQVLAPSMQQSIEVLLLPLQELSQHIEAELQENPMLEIEDPITPKEDHKIEQILDQSIEYLQSQPYKIHQTSYDTSMDDEQPETRQISQTTCLEDYLLRQLHLEMSESVDIKIGEFIIGNLTDDGYLKCSLEEIAAFTDVEDLHYIERILKSIQLFDPLGIASRDLKECLLIQAPFYFNGKAQTMTHLIDQQLENLGRKKYQDISRDLKIPVDEVKSLAQMVSRLDPKPARRFRNSMDNIYIKPDITVLKRADGKTLQLIMNKERVPHLRISATYRSFLNKGNLTAEESEYIREKIKSGLLFIKSIEQRQETIKNIAKFILKHQRDFFFQGSSGLKPLVLKDVAQAIERNESTISRAISNKYMETPQGLFPMKYFFSQGLTQEQSESSVSSRSIQEELRTIVEDEDKSKPYSDQDLVHLLQNRGMKVARRTITKYRKALKILPSNLRKQ